MSKLPIRLIAVGKLKSNSPYAPLFTEYTKRLMGGIDVVEIATADQKTECDAILKKIDPSLPLIALDETGQSFKSTAFAKKLEQFAGQKIQFVIGGADGLSDEIRNKANFTLNLGRLTWPHMMVRVMLVEQLYRAQQILANHPYHRE